jgi:HEAT repeat protein
MRWTALLLFLTSSLFAQEEGLLVVFRDSAAEAYTSGGKGKAERAIAALGEKGGARSVDAIATFIRDGFKAEDELRADQIKVEKRGFTAYASVERVQRELDHLAHRESAGATGLGPQITAREHKLRELNKTVEGAKSQTMRLARMQDTMIKQRERCVIATCKILARLKPKELVFAIGLLRRALDIDKANQSLFLVRTLRASGRKEASPALLEVFSHPKAAVPVRIEAASAVAQLKDANSTRDLIARLKKEPAFDNKRVLHAFGMAAKKRIADLDAASEWARTLK